MEKISIEDIKATLKEGQVIKLRKTDAMSIHNVIKGKLLKLKIIKKYEHYVLCQHGIFKESFTYFEIWKCLERRG